MGEHLPLYIPATNSLSVCVDPPSLFPNKAFVRHKREGTLLRGIGSQGSSGFSFLTRVSNISTFGKYPRPSVSGTAPQNEANLTTFAPPLPPACICDTSPRGSLPLRLSIYLLRSVSFGAPLLQTKHTSNAPHKSSLPLPPVIFSRYSRWRRFR